MRCATPTPGPDKTITNTLYGAGVGAGAGAVTGAQLAAGSGPGVAVGAGFGAVLGGIHGALVDIDEGRLLQFERESNKEKQRAIVHQILADHYQRRMALHPTRDIFPADLFFYGDEYTLRPSSAMLVDEICKDE